MTYEIQKHLVLSTGHVCRETMEKLNFWAAEPKDAPFSIGNYSEYGWFFRALSPDNEGFVELPEDLAAIMRFASDEAHCRYIMLDRDAAAVEDLPYYEW